MRSSGFDWSRSPNGSPHSHDKDWSVGSPSSPSSPGIAAAVAAANTNNGKKDGNSLHNNNTSIDPPGSDDQDIGFVPSFYSSTTNRRSISNPGPRRRGNVSSSTSVFNPKSNAEPIDELDRMLNSNKPTKKIFDPFASAEKSKPSTLRNDSSSDDEAVINKGKSRMNQIPNLNDDSHSNKSIQSEKEKFTAIPSLVDSKQTKPLSISKLSDSLDDSSSLLHLNLKGISSNSTLTATANTAPNNVGNLQELKPTSKIFQTAINLDDSMASTSSLSNLVGLPSLESPRVKPPGYDDSGKFSARAIDIEKEKDKPAAIISGKSAQAPIRRKKQYDFDSDEDDELDIRGIVKDVVVPPAASSHSSSQSSPSQKTAPIPIPSKPSASSSNATSSLASSPPVKSNVFKPNISVDTAAPPAPAPAPAHATTLGPAPAPLPIPPPVSSIGVSSASAQAQHSTKAAATSTRSNSITSHSDRRPSTGTTSSAWGSAAITTATDDLLELSTSLSASPPMRRMSGGERGTGAGPVSGLVTPQAKDGHSASTAAAIPTEPAELLGLDSSVTLARNTRNSDAAVRKLQVELETTKLQGEAIERQLRLEIDSLKGRLSVSKPANSSAAAGLATSTGAAAASSAALATAGVGNDLDSSVNLESSAFAIATPFAPRSTPMASDQSSAKLLREISDLRRINAQLESEINRLKDEATIQQLRHREELKLEVQKHAQDAEDLERRKEQDVQLIEKRHAETVAALKAIHTEELASIRERLKDGVVMDKLSNQIQHASGSIKLIEEELSVRFRGLEAAKQGQLEARERLLSELEDGARARAEAAEAEGYRLKGLLVHMEHVLSSVRSQTSEEKERLRHEHQRLEAMQAALESDRIVLHKRAADEMALLKQKQKELDAESYRLKAEKLELNEQIATSKREMEEQKAEFQAMAAASAKAAEDSANKLRAEENRIKGLREAANKERLHLDQGKAELRREFGELEAYKERLLVMKLDIETEKQRFSSAARELQQASENIQKEVEVLDHREDALRSREKALQDGIRAMQSNAKALENRELQLLDGIRVLEAQQVQMEQIDNDLLEKRIKISAVQRQCLNQQAQVSRDSAIRMSGIAPFEWQSGATSLPLPPGRSSNLKKQHEPLYDDNFANSQSFAGLGGPKTPPYNASHPHINSSFNGSTSFTAHHNIDSDSATPNPSREASQPKSWTEQFHAQLQNTGGSKLLQRQALLKDPAVSELLAAQNTLQSIRASLEETSVGQLHRKQFLAKEEPFLAALEKQRNARKYDED